MATLGTTILGIELNDAALSGAGPDGTVFCEPAYALLEDGALQLGQQVLAKRRLRPRAVSSHYFSELSEASLAGAQPPFNTNADLVHAHLQQLWQAHGAAFDQVVLAVPQYWTGEQLSLLLGIADEVGMPVAGLTSSAIAATRREYPGQRVFHLEAGLHNFSMREIDQQGGLASVGEERNLHDFGYITFERAVVGYVAARLLECSRFDVFQTAASEQSVYDLLPDWLRSLNQQATLDIEIRHGEYLFSASLTCDGVKQALREASEPLLQQLRSFVPSGRSNPVVLQCHSLLDAFPGLLELFEEETGAMAYLLEPAAAARGAMRRAASLSSGSQGYSYVTSLPWDQPPVDVASEAGASGGVVPTHIVYGGKAYRLPDGSFVVGAEVLESERGLQIDAGAGGISRHHFSIDMSEGQPMLREHSRFGTRLNGYPVDTLVSLRAGDVVSIGEPAEVFVLVAEVTEPGDGA